MISRLILTFVVLSFPVGLLLHYLGVTWASVALFIIFCGGMVVFMTWILLQAIWEDYF